MQHSVGRSCAHIGAVFGNTGEMPSLGFLHTSAVHVPTFDRLVAEIAPGTKVVSVVDESLLADARRLGVLDPSVTRRLELALDELARAVVDVVVCTCSTIGGQAEAVGAAKGLSVVRVDRPMAERALEIGGRIVVVAAVESTLVPTRELLESVAADVGADLDLRMELVDAAWERFEAGDQDGYRALIAASLPAIARTCDVIVLAQASMAGAADLVELGVPVLSSPPIAVEAMLG